jgi:hypothetical protein
MEIRIWKQNFVKQKWKRNFFGKNENRTKNGTAFSGGTDAETEFPFPTNVVMWNFYFTVVLYRQYSRPTM